MPKVSDLFFKTAIVWLILGIGAGLQMAISGDHGAFPAHAHINLARLGHICNLWRLLRRLTGQRRRGESRWSTTACITSGW